MCINDRYTIRLVRVSVPIRGLFNLTLIKGVVLRTFHIRQVSVPIRGLFNLTSEKALLKQQNEMLCFRPHQGII